MIDFLFLVYLLYGVYYAGYKAKDIIKNLATDSEGDYVEQDRWGITLIFVTILLHVAFWLFFVGMDSYKEE